MASFAEKILKQRMGNTGYDRGTSTSQSSRRVVREVVPPGEPPSDENVDLTPDGRIVRRRRARNQQLPMRDLDIDLDISAPITNNRE